MVASQPQHSALIQGKKRLSESVFGAGTAVHRFAQHQPLSHNRPSFLSLALQEAALFPDTPAILFLLSKNNMQKIEAVIQPSKLDAVKDALLAIGVEGMTILEARGHGRQKGHTEFYRGREYTVDLLPKIKLETVVPDELLEKAIQAIITSARTGKIGDGKIFVTGIDEAIRIRNGERGEAAL